MTGLPRAFWLYLLVAVWVNNFVSCGQCASRVNVALNKAASQISTKSIQDGTGEARKAVDGVTSGSKNCQSCSSTKLEAYPWWMVDLGGKFLVAEVVISNRNFVSLSNLLRNFTIEVADSLERDGSLTDPVVCAEQADPQPPASTMSYPCLRGTIHGRYVRITKQVIGILILCEVQVFEPDKGGEDKNTNPICWEQFALHKTNVMPSDPPFYSTSSVIPMFCASLCLTMDECASFTVNSTNQKLWECRLYECKMSRLDTVYGSRYFVERFLLV